MQYYLFDTEEQAKELSAAIYDLNAPPKGERSTLYACQIYSNEEQFAIEFDDGAFDPGELLAGLDPYTENEIIILNFDLEKPLVI